MILYDGASKESAINTIQVIVEYERERKRDKKQIQNQGLPSMNDIDDAMLEGAGELPLSFVEKKIGGFSPKQTQYFSLPSIRNR